jgi:putative addiction module antidote
MMSAECRMKRTFLLTLRSAFIVLQSQSLPDLRLCAVQLLLSALEHLLVVIGHRRRSSGQGSVVLISDHLLECLLPTLRYGGLDTRRLLLLSIRDRLGLHWIVNTPVNSAQRADAKNYYMRCNFHQHADFLLLSSPIGWLPFVITDVIICAMAMKLKLTAIGNSTGIILPKELLEKLRVQKGDMLHVLETPDGIKLTALDETFADQMDIAEDVMREDRDILHRLAQ